MTKKKGMPSFDKIKNCHSRTFRHLSISPSSMTEKIPKPTRPSIPKNRALERFVLLAHFQSEVLAQSH